MFDDQPSSTGVQAPSNLPVGEPEDIFSPAESDSADPLPTPLPEVEAAIPQSPSALDAGALRPAQTFAEQPPRPTPAVPNLETKPLAFTDDEMSETPETPPVRGAAAQPPFMRGAVISISVIVVIVLGVLGWWWLTHRYAAAADAVIPPAQPTAPPSTDGAAMEQKSSADMVDTSVLFGQPIDRDGDGLDDVTEQDLGTDPNNWDTDGDILSDHDEVQVWHTDPRNPDSDGDSYQDGTEVKNGYSPTGPGKLFDQALPTTTSAF